MSFLSLDFTRDQVVAQLQFSHLDVSPAQKESLPIVRALQGERVSGELYRVCTADQGDRIVAIYTAPVYQDGQVDGVVTLWHDLTEIKQTEKERERLLHEIDAERARLQSILEALPVGVWVADASGKMTLVNDAAAKILGGQAPRVDRVEEYTVYPIWWPETGERVPVQDYPLARALRGETVKDLVLDFERFDGTRGTHLASSTPIQDSQGQVVGGVVVAQDITAQRQAEQALREALAAAEESRQLSEARNRINDLLVSSLDATTVLPQVLAEIVQGLGLKYGVFLYRQGESWVAGPVHGLPQLSSGQVFSEQEAELTTWAARHRQVLAVEDVTRDPRFQATVLRGYGVRSFMAVPLILQERVTGALLVGSSEVVHFRPAQLDSARKVAYGLALAQENARLYEQAQKDAETRATLLREVNHRVKNNLAAIVGLMYAQLARQDVQNQPICQDVLHNLILGTENLSIVHGMLAAVEWAPLPLDELVSRVLRSTLQVVPGEQLVIQVRPSMLRVTSNQAHTLALVVNELATNMAKYALAGRTTLQVTATAERIDDEAVLTIRDDGPGYPADVLAEIRSGAGLELVRNLVARNLRGQLVLRNESGAVTEVRFPLTEAQSEG